MLWTFDFDEWRTADGGTKRLIGGNIKKTTFDHFGGEGQHTLEMRLRA